MVSFSCEGCGDVLTKKKLDPHRNQCYGASYTCLDCMVHFEGTSYRAHTSCITEDQKYQGKLYREPKNNKKQPQHQKKDSVQQNVQALVPSRNAYVEDENDADDNAVAIVDAPPRAPTPPPAGHSLGYAEQAALPAVNVFDFLDASETPAPTRTRPVDESRMIEDSVPPAYPGQEPNVSVTDVMKFQVPDDDDDDFAGNGFAYGNEPVRPTNERFDSSYNTRELDPRYSYTTPAPKSKHNRTKSRDKDVDTTIKKAERKRKRNSPAELDMSLVRAQEERDTMMAEAPPILHSGLTGGLNRLLHSSQFPPTPDHSGDWVENSPLSPMKRAKQGASKALLRAQKDFEVQQEKDRKAELKEERQREKEERKERERGRERERKERKASTALVKIRPKMTRRDDSERSNRKHRSDGVERRRRRETDSSGSPPRPRKNLKAIEYHRSESQSSALDTDRQLIVRPNGDVATLKKEHEARAELFMSFVNKGPDSERGMSVNKTLKRYHRERHDYDHHVSKVDEEKELWKSLRLKRNDRGEIVLFFAPPDGETA
ncbi:hypothetical protein BU23DRAFT_581542 [Bimuria novae-zelandiae CBS 107.79]|uniref:Zinc finger C2H2 LYAR-type domain-containing protein n=1 Tax=Bimuria novae-zelandiae CBS 107.79 TaxID=1447943 RepID=A0A6A5V2D4_9PLEO|nr:hypothetical protein BU23DRAFT_581542 [Bimuria novae-zelandiae CBS 107.79]